MGHNINLKNLSFSYDKNDKTPLLNNINLSIGKGEICCLVGASGNGKSTILRLIAGLEELKHGSIDIDDKIASSANNHTPSEQRNVGLVFQHPALFPHLSVLDNVTFGLKSMPKKQARIIAKELLTQVRYNGDIKAYPHTLSGGQHQRVALARALAPAPHTLLLDEPFANLDNILRSQIKREIFDLLRKKSTTVMMVTHDPEEALNIADKICLIGKGGTVHQYGTPQELYYQPINEYAAKFFGRANIIDIDVLSKIFAADVTKNNHSKTVMIRPEMIDISTDSGQTNALVKDIKFYGSYRIITAESAGVELLIANNKNLNIKPDDEISISINPDNIHYFS